MQSSDPSLRRLLNRPVASGREYALRVVAAIAVLAALVWWLHDHPATSSLKLTRQCLESSGFDVNKVAPRQLQVGDDLLLTFAPSVDAAKKTGGERKRNVLFRGDHSELEIERCLDRAAR